MITRDTICHVNSKPRSMEYLDSENFAAIVLFLCVDTSDILSRCHRIFVRSLVVGSNIILACIRHVTLTSAILPRQCQNTTIRMNAFSQFQSLRTFPISFLSAESEMEVNVENSQIKYVRFFGDLKGTGTNSAKTRLSIQASKFILDE